MKRAVPMESASAFIDEKIKELGDWREKPRDRRNVHQLLVRVTPQREPQGGTHFIHPCGTKLGHASS
jgi:hypothetical protein